MTTVLEHPVLSSRQCQVKVGNTGSSRPIGAALSGLVCLMISGCSGEAPRIFNSRTSPDGTWRAENVGYVEDCCGGGFIWLRNLKDRSYFRKIATLPEPAPELFLSWTDDTHLTIWTPTQIPASVLAKPTQHEDVIAKFQLYKIPRNDNQTYHTAKKVIREDLRPDSIRSEFWSQNTEHGPSCVLKISARPQHFFSMAELKVTAGYACQKSKACTGLFSDFSVSSVKETRRNLMLTSATVSDIASYNRLPDGEGGRAVRGQFLGSNASFLTDELTKPSFDLQYSFNFFDTIIDLKVPTEGILVDIRSFELCIGH